MLKTKPNIKKLTDSQGTNYRPCWFFTVVVFEKEGNFMNW